MATKMQPIRPPAPMTDPPSQATNPDAGDGQRGQQPWTPPFGAIGFAERIERRRFLRGTGRTLFYGLAAVSVGGIGLGSFLANPASAQGCGCAYACCGDSPCCNTSCCNKACCSVGSSACANDGKTCFGFDYGDYTTTACWSCFNPGGCYTVTCCDCKTNNEAGCANSIETNRCICWRRTHGC